MTALICEVKFALFFMVPVMPPGSGFFLPYRRFHNSIKKGANSGGA
jgi:hypothetical protein